MSDPHSPRPSRFERSTALIFGIDAYPTNSGFRALQAPTTDARTLAALLGERHGYDVDVRLDQAATLAGMRKALRDLIEGHDDVPGLGEKDRLLFFFAGHGLVERRDRSATADPNEEAALTGYLIPADAVHDHLDTYLSMRELWQSLIDSPCRHVLFVLDCCCAGAFRWAPTRSLLRVKTPKRVPRQLFERYTRSSSWQVLASTAFDEPALDDGRWLKRPKVYDGVHSPFAHFLLAGLSGAADLNQDGLILGVDLFSYIEGGLAGLEHAADQDLQHPVFFNLRCEDRAHFFFEVPNTQLSLQSVELNTASNPYRGLEAYDEAGRDVFFGRERAVQDLCQKVLSGQLTVVSAVSGAGKSSLLRAGLIPQLKSAGLRVFLLDRPQEQPTVKLTNLLARSDYEDAGAVQALVTEAVLVIDQAEELCTLVADQAERDAFLARLCQILARGRMRVILAVRSDFEYQLARSALSAYWVSERRFLLLGMRDDELREVIEGPAEQCALRFESPRLVDDLIGEVRQMPGALPLLSFTLSYLYEQYLASGASDRTLKTQTFHELKGVTGSLHQRMNGLLDELGRRGAGDLDAPTATTLRDLMLRMVTQEGAGLARRRAFMRELVYSSDRRSRQTRTLIDELVEKRLLIRGQDETTGAELSDNQQDAAAALEARIYVEPAHDALVTSWVQVHAWLHELRQVEIDLALHRRLLVSATEWERSAHSLRVLWAESPRLPSAEALLDYGLLNQLEQEFVYASVAERRAAGRRRLGVVLGVIATLIGVIVIIALFYSRALNSETKLTDANKKLDESNNQLEEQVSQTKKANQELNERNADLQTTNKKLEDQIKATDAERAKKEVALGKVRIKNQELTEEQARRHNEKCLKAALIFAESDPTIAALFLLEATAQSAEWQRTAKKVLAQQLSSLVLSPQEQPGWNGIFADFTADRGKLIAALSREKKTELCVWNLDGGTLTPKPGRCRSSEELRNLELSLANSNNLLLATPSRSAGVLLFSIGGSSLHEPRRLDAGSQAVMGARLSSDGSTVIGGIRGEARASLWRRDGGGDYQRIDVSLAAQADAIAWSGRHRLLFVGPRQTAQVLSWSLQSDGSLSPRPPIATDAPVNKLRLSGDGGTLLVLGTSGRVTVYSLNGDAPHKIDSTSSGFNLAQLDAAGRRLFVAHSSGSASLRTLDPSGRSATTTVFTGHTASIEDIAFSEDAEQRYLLTNSSDNTVRLWDSQNGIELWRLSGHLAEQNPTGRRISTARFSPNGRLIVTTGRDGTVRLWPRARAAAPTDSTAALLERLKRGVNACLSATAREAHLTETQQEAAQGSRACVLEKLQIY